jgi:sugar phosphate isomerase/epimerase
VRESRRRETRKRLGDRGLVVSNINAFTHFVDGDTYHPTWIDEDPDRVRLRSEHTKRSIDLAAEFGCRTVSIQPGGPLIEPRVHTDAGGHSHSLKKVGLSNFLENMRPLGSDVGARRDVAMRRFAEALAPCAEYARSRGVTIGVEPEPGLLIQTAAEYLEFKSTYFAHDDSVRMNCDIGHLFCVGDDPAEVIRVLAPHIAHVHLEDIGANRVHQHLAPGRGVIDFSSVRDALRQIGYSGWSTVELYPYETTAAGVAEAAHAQLAPLFGNV